MRKIKDCQKKAVLFFKKYGFMDLTRFCSYFKDLNLSTHELIDLYLKTFKK